ncbi:MAG: NADH-quinone oxidoreductase subunit A [Planctomycetales bacterium]|nr:NADH-quinone oxidoreductase subunit A [Planctomycetales bacterium]
MSPPIDSSTGIVGYLAFFGGFGFVFVFANLLLGRFLRPANPNEEKLEIYECGEPAIGSSFVQFDLRFYVVALIFIIFDVEVAFLFPWATVFGKATNLAASNGSLVEVVDGQAALTKSAELTLKEMGVRSPEISGTAADAAAMLNSTIDSIVKLTTVEVLVFFAILLVGFAYVWRMGALDWVRATVSQRPVDVPRPAPSPSRRQESVLSA